MQRIKKRELNERKAILAECSLNTVAAFNTGLVNMSAKSDMFMSRQTVATC